MRPKKPLTDSEKVKVAEILERTNAGSLDFLAMMIEMHTMGVRAKEKDNEYTYWWDYIRPQVEQSLYGKRIMPAEPYPLYSKWLEDKIWQFADEVIKEWFLKVFKKVSQYLDDRNLEWDACYMHDFNNYTGYVVDELMETLDNKNGEGSYMFGLPREMWAMNMDEMEEMEVEDAE